MVQACTKTSHLTGTWTANECRMPKDVASVVAPLYTPQVHVFDLAMVVKRVRRKEHQASTSADNPTHRSDTCNKTCGFASAFSAMQGVEVGHNPVMTFSTYAGQLFFNLLILSVEHKGSTPMITCDRWHTILVGTGLSRQCQT